MANLGYRVRTLVPVEVARRLFSLFITVKSQPRFRKVYISFMPMG
jgi:hypothetical protein